MKISEVAFSPATFTGRRVDAPRAATRSETAFEAANAKLEFSLRTTVETLFHRVVVV